MDEEEEWRDVVDDPIHQVSSTARVRNKQTKRILKQNHSHGNPTVNIRRNDRVESAKVHKLVMESFDGLVVRPERLNKTKNWVVDPETGEVT